MPYIKSDDNRRSCLIAGHPAQNAGELNFQIASYIKSRTGTFPYESKIVKRFVDNFLGENTSYQKYNDMTGCLTCCYKEILRRLGISQSDLLRIRDSYDEEIANYEDVKMKENGDFI